MGSVHGELKDASVGILRVGGGRRWKEGDAQIKLGNAKTVCWLNIGAQGNLERQGLVAEDSDLIAEIRR